MQSLGSDNFKSGDGGLSNYRRCKRKYYRHHAIIIETPPVHYNQSYEIPCKYTNAGNLYCSNLNGSVQELKISGRSDKNFRVLRVDWLMVFSC